MNPPLIIYLDDTYLKLYWKKAVYRFDFPQFTVKYHSLVRQSKFTDELKQFMEKIKIEKVKALMILSGNIVYSAVYQDVSKFEELTKHFFSYLPVDETNLSKVVVTEAGTTYCFAVQSDMYKAVYSTISLYTADIEFIVPENIFGFNLGDRDLSDDDLKKIDQTQHLLHKANFLVQNKHNEIKISSEEKLNPDELSVKKPKRSSVKTAVYSLMGVFCTAGLVYGSLSFLNVDLNAVYRENIDAADITPTVTMMPVVVKTKQELKIRIINASNDPLKLSYVSEAIYHAGYTISSQAVIENALFENSLIVINLADQNTSSNLQKILGAGFILVSEGELNGWEDTEQYDINIIIGTDFK